jgi:hypothetical protein
MKSVAVRLTLLGLFVVSTGVAAYFFWTGEARARTNATAARAFDEAAFGAERDVLELRAAQEAYVAAGQGEQFWTSKVAAAIGALRDKLNALRGQAISLAAQSAVDNAVSALQDFEQMDRRARDYVRGGQKLLASDMIFADSLEITGAMAGSLAQARSAELQAGEASTANIRRRQILAGSGAAGVGLLVIALLVLRRGTPEILAVPAPNPAPSPDFRVPATSDIGVALDEGWSRSKPVAHAASPVALPIDLGAVASLCSDLARVVDTQALPAILGRTAGVLDAPGIVLWIADPDGRELSPIITHGYSAQLVSRLGTILRDAENVTAAAFRTSLLQTVNADAVSNGAIAAPLVTPVGCVGVMAAEVRSEGERDSAKLAAATIVAAQLATLVGPPSTRAQAKAEASGA